MTPTDRSRRSFLKSSAALAAAAPLAAGLAAAQPQKAAGPLLAYVGTFSAPLRDVPPTQVDLPPGNGRGVHLFRVDRATGALSPAGVHEMGTSPSHLALNAAGTRLYSANETDRADGRFVYAGNRLHDSVAVFSVGPDGGLKYAGEEWMRGDYPRNFDLDPTGEFLCCCNQRADNVTAFRVDRRAGGLRFTGHYAPVGNPSCVVFLELKKQDGSS